LYRGARIAGLEFRDDLLGLSVTYNIAKPVAKAVVADAKMMIAALDTLQQQLACLRRFSHRDVVDEKALAAEQGRVFDPLDRAATAETADRSVDRHGFLVVLGNERIVAAGGKRRRPCD
jgi:hypothetical protein